MSDYESTERAPVPTGGAPTGEAGMSPNSWAMLCHFGAFAGFFVPFGNVLGPLVVWLVKRDSLPVVDRQGKAAVNFQLTVAILAAAITVGSVVLSVVGIGILTGMLGALAYYAVILIFPLLAGLAANEGREYRYPFSFQLIR